MLFLKGSRNFSLQSQPSALVHREDTSLSSSLDTQTGLALPEIVGLMGWGSSYGKGLV